MGAVQTNLHEEEGTLIIHRVQDVQPIMEFAHKQQVSGHVGSKEMRHAASIPMVLVEAYCNDKGISFDQFMADPAHIKTMCNDPALKAFRVWEGRV